LEQGAVFNCSTFGPHPSLIGIDACTQGEKLALCTRGGSIYEISAVDGANLHTNALIRGHSWGNLTSCATHPTRQEFATGGTDGYLFVWDGNYRVVCAEKHFSDPIGAIIYGLVATTSADELQSGNNDTVDSKNQAILVCGLAGHTNEGQCGSFYVLRAETLEVTFTSRDSHCAVTELKLTPDAETLAVGTADGGMSTAPSL
jgi:WD40 repeat protein